VRIERRHGRVAEGPEAAAAHTSRVIRHERWHEEHETRNVARRREVGDVRALEDRLYARVLHVYHGRFRDDVHRLLQPANLHIRDDVRGEVAGYDDVPAGDGCEVL
jgi:hypothetical protein